MNKSEKYACDMSPSTYTKNSYITPVDALHLSQQWKIENFTTLVKLALPGNCLRTGLFRHPQLPEAFWQLCLYPGGKRAENANNVSLFLKMSSTSPTKEVRIKVEYRFHFLNDKEVALFSNVNVGEFHAKPPKGGHSWGLRNIPKQKILNCVRDDGSLVISCHIELLPDINRTQCYNSWKLLNTNSRTVSGDFVKRQLAAFDDGFMADCVLECSGKQIPVNKFVLSAHSEVFKAMFSYDQLIESTEKKVIIEDAEYEAVRCMLRYMYTGEMEVDSEIANVLILAERYQIDDLKLICERELCTQIDKNNIGEMLYLADLYNCKILRRAVVDLLRTNPSVFSSNAWRLLKETNPHLVTEIMEKAMFGEESPPLKRQCHQKLILGQPSDDEST
uniref:BTB domain-containing protein n=2 Tax=Onchocerca TaxID=6281 RepID=A0A8R1TM96_ONCVO